MNQSYYDEMRGRLLALLDFTVQDRLSAEAASWTQDYLDHNELGLALELIANCLSEAEASLSAGERSTTVGLAYDVGMTDGRVERAIGSFPRTQPGALAGHAHGEFSCDPLPRITHERCALYHALAIDAADRA